MVSNLDALRYKFWAYLVIRDAIGFFFGIPKFFSELDLEEIKRDKLEAKLKDNPKASDKQIEKYQRSIDKSIESRINFLKEDHEFCKDVLFTDNLWLQWLDINPEFFKVYLSKLSPDVVNELAVIPSWTIRDDSLRRPYLNSDKGVKEIKF